MQRQQGPTSFSVKPRSTRKPKQIIPKQEEGEEGEEGEEITPPVITKKPANSGMIMRTSTAKHEDDM